MDNTTLGLFVSAVALFLAAASFWISWKEIRRCNKVILKLDSCQHSSGENIETGKSTRLKVVLVNCGIPLKHIKLQLLFQGRNLGWIRLPFNNNSTTDGDFLRGTRAEYELIEHIPIEVSNNSIYPLLSHLPFQQASLVAYVNKYDVARFRIGGRWDRFKGWVNSIIGRIEMRCSKTYKRPGKCDMIKMPRYPKFKYTLYRPVIEFLDEVKRQGD